MTSSEALLSHPDRGRRLIGLAHGLLLKRHGDDIATARKTIFNREQHVGQGLHYLSLARAAQADAVLLEERNRSGILRPKWLTSRLYTIAKLLLVISEITAGTSALFTAGDALPLAILTFTGMAIATVMAGTHIGIQKRRREMGEQTSLIPTAILSVVLATAMLLVTRYWTIGRESAVLAFVTTMVALGSAFLGYQWHDPVADELSKANDLHANLQARANREFDHKSVRRFEAAESVLRPAIFQALQNAYADITGRNSALSKAVGSAGAEVAADEIPAPDRAMVDTMLEMLVGPEILSLTPKVEK